MNTQQLIGWMNEPSNLGKDASAQLDTLTQSFPYFQTAQLLYIKSLHNENSFLYNNQLKISAAYATNRKVLYELITKKGSGEKRKEKEKEREKENGQQVNLEIKKENDGEENRKVESNLTESSEIGIETKAEIIQPAFPKKRFTKDEDDWESGMMRQLQLLHHWKTTPQEILAKRIEEINAEKEAAKKAEENKKEPTAADEINTLLYVLVEPGDAEDISTAEEQVLEDHSKESSNEWEVKILDEEEESAKVVKSDLKMVPQDAISQEIMREAISSSIELEVDNELPTLEDLGHKTISERKLLSPEKLSSDEQETPTEEVTFGNWLKHLNPVQKIVEETDKQPIKSELVDKFIQDSPRIQVNKATFFSPVNMAKKSVQDSDEFITETLAKIYIKQGNISKGIRAYQKLSLKFPEKSSYFAALIEELKRTPKP